MILRFKDGPHDGEDQEFDGPQPPISRTLAIAQDFESVIEVSEYRVIDQAGNCKFLKPIKFNISRSGEQANFKAYMQTHHLLWILERESA
jgi:hypothetical protein